MVMLFIFYGTFITYLSSNFIDDLDDKVLYLNVNTERTTLRNHLNVSGHSLFPSKVYFTNELDGKEGVEVWQKESKINRKIKFKTKNLSPARKPGGKAWDPAKTLHNNTFHNAGKNENTKKCQDNK